MEYKDNKKLNKKGAWFVLYHADWCGFCVRMMPEWKKLEKQNNHVNVAKIESANITATDIQSYPTIMFYYNGKGQKYEGERTVEEFNKFLSKVCKDCGKLKK